MLENSMSILGCTVKTACSSSLLQCGNELITKCAMLGRMPEQERMVAVDLVTTLLPYKVGKAIKQGPRASQPLKTSRRRAQVRIDSLFCFHML
jgi:hypothetical protein